MSDKYCKAQGEFIFPVSSVEIFGLIPHKYRRHWSHLDIGFYLYHVSLQMAAILISWESVWKIELIQTWHLDKLQKCTFVWCLFGRRNHERPDVWEVLLKMDSELKSFSLQ